MENQEELALPLTYSTIEGGPRSRHRGLRLISVSLKRQGTRNLNSSFWLIASVPNLESPEASTHKALPYPSIYTAWFRSAASYARPHPSPSASNTRSKWRCRCCGEKAHWRLSVEAPCAVLQAKLLSSNGTREPTLWRVLRLEGTICRRTRGRSTLQTFARSYRVSECQPRESYDDSACTSSQRCGLYSRVTTIWPALLLTTCQWTLCYTPADLIFTAQYFLVPRDKSLR